MTLDELHRKYMESTKKVDKDIYLMEILSNCRKLAGRLVYKKEWKVEETTFESILLYATYKSVIKWIPGRASFSTFFYRVFMTELAQDFRNNNKGSSLKDYVSLSMVVNENESTIDNTLEQCLMSDYKLEDDIEFREDYRVLLKILNSDIISPTDRIMVYELNIFGGDMTIDQCKKKYDIKKGRSQVRLLRDKVNRAVKFIEQNNLIIDEYIEKLERKDPSLHKTTVKAYFNNKKERLNMNN